MRRFLPVLGAFALLATTAATSHGQYDLSGRWMSSGTTTFLGETWSFAHRHWDVVQTAGTLSVTITSEEGYVSGPHSGTINEATGAFHVSLPAPPPGRSGSIDGNVAFDSRSFSATGVSYSCAPSLICIEAQHTYDGTRCGNGEPDDGEQCDDDNATAGDCCSPTCSFESAGSTCGSDDNECTDDRCDGAGTCQHTSNTASCIDSAGCTAGTCDDGACVPSTPLAAGASCDLDADLCTDDACDGAGTCVAGGAVDCAPCGVCDSTLGCVADSGFDDGCENQPGMISLSVRLGAPRRTSVKLRIDEHNVYNNFRIEDFGDPALDTDYTFCLYSFDGDNAPSVVVSALVPAGGTCGADSCWTHLDGNVPSYVYKNKERAPHGVSSIKLSGRGITLRAGKEHLAAAARFTPGHLALIPRLVGSNGASSSCWIDGVVPKIWTATKFKGENTLP